MVAWWPLDETAGTAAQDRTPYGNDGVLVGPLGWGAGHVRGAHLQAGEDGVDVVAVASSLDYSKVHYRRPGCVQWA
jgi:hypothetical protein